MTRSLCQEGTEGWRLEDEKETLAVFFSQLQCNKVDIRDVRGGEFSLGAGRGGARKKIFGAGRGKGKNLRGGAGRGKKARKLTDLQNSTKTRKWKICV